MTHHFACEDCRAQSEAKRKDAKVCKSCRLLRNLVYCTTKFKRAKKCRACGDRFRPFHVRDLSHCAGCSAEYTKLERGACRRCKKTGPLVEGVPVCLHCVKGDETQEKVMIGLRKGQAERKAASV